MLRAAASDDRAVTLYRMVKARLGSRYKRSFQKAFREFDLNGDGHVRSRLRTAVCLSESVVRAGPYHLAAI